MRQTPLDDFTLWSQRDLSEADLLEARRNLQNARREVGRDFGRALPDVPFDVILTDYKVFQQYSKSPSHVAGLFDGKIHIPVPSFLRDKRALQAILWHEYTHALVWFYSRGYCPGWLSEGFAVYEENKIVQWTLGGDPKVLVQNGKLRIPLAQLDQALQSMNSLPVDQVVAVYHEAFMAAEYLMDRYSSATMRDFLMDMGQGGSFEKSLKKVLHITPEKLEVLVVEHISKR